MALRIIRRLAGLLDVDTSGVADGEALTYEASTQLWKPVAGGGDPVTAGDSWLNPVVLDDAAYAMVGTYPSRPFPDATYSPEGLTLTANATGALAVDDASPSVGDRIAVWDYDNPSGNAGVYVVTDAGGVDSAWMLTRAADLNTGEQYCRFWTVRITGGTAFAGGYMYVSGITPGAALVGDSGVKIAVAAADVGNAGVALGSTALALHTAVAIGYGAKALGIDSAAIGASAIATDDTGQAVGDNTVAAAGGTAIGSSANALGNQSTALGSSAYVAEAAVNGTAIGREASVSAVDATAVGKGTTAAAEGVTVVDGPNGSKLVLKSPGGMKYYITVDDSGVLGTTAA